MSKVVVTVDGDTIDGLLHDNLGSYTEATEDLFYQLNPGISVHGPVFQSGISIKIPEPVKDMPAKRFGAFD